MSRYGDVMESKSKKNRQIQKRIPKEDIGFYCIVLIVAMIGLYFFVEEVITSIQEQTKKLPAQMMNNSIVQQDVKILEEVSKVTSNFSNAFSIEEEPFAEQSGERIESKVVHVIKSNLYQVKIAEKVVNVRLIGITAPEDSMTADKQTKETAIEAVKSHIQEGKILYLETDTILKDEYSNLWVYAYFEDGQMVQEWLLTNGYANFKEESQNQKYQEQLRSAAKK